MTPAAVSRCANSKFAFRTFPVLELELEASLERVADADDEDDDDDDATGTCADDIPK
jgi:hypothetical protein